MASTFQEDMMDEEKGNELYSRIMSLAHAISSREAGRKVRHQPGTILRASREIYDSEPEVRDGLAYKEWWKLVHRSHTPQQPKKQPSRTNGEGSEKVTYAYMPRVGSVARKYMEAILKLEGVPGDEIVAGILGTAPDTLRKARTRLKKAGWEFVSDHDGWKVFPPLPVPSPVVLQETTPHVLPPAMPPVVERPILVPAQAQTPAPADMVVVLEDSQPRTPTVADFRVLAEQRKKSLAVEEERLAVEKERLAVEEKRLAVEEKRLAVEERLAQAWSA